MMKGETFRVDHPTGYIQINVGYFFGSTDKKRIGKFLRIARQYCSDERRIELVEAMEKEFLRRKEALDALGELEYKRAQILDSIYKGYTQRPLPAPEKALLKQNVKLTENIKSLETERWEH